MTALFPDFCALKQVPSVDKACVSLSTDGTVEKGDSPVEIQSFENARILQSCLFLCVLAQKPVLTVYVKAEA